MAASVLNREPNCKFFAFPHSETGAKKPEGKQQDGNNESLLPAAII